MRMFPEGRFRRRRKKHERIHGGLKWFARRMWEDPTTPEYLMWEALRLKRLGGHRFRRQHVIEPYIVDFYCPQAKVVVEVDGESHLWRADEDDERNRMLLESGISVVRVTNDHVRCRMEDVKKVIRSAINESLLTGSAALYSLPEE